MSDHVIMEEPLHFGEGGRLFGILTQPGVRPRNAQELPVFVFLNSGLLHRVGPHRLYVLIARALAEVGFTSLRVDLAGNGDSPARSGLTHQQSVAMDYDEILDVLDKRMKRVPIVLAGLCSGADNSIRLTPNSPRVVGMVLLDPFFNPIVSVRLRNVLRKYTSPPRYVAWVKRRINALINPSRVEERALDIEDVWGVNLVAMRDAPTLEQTRAAFELICERRGRVLCGFTGSARWYCSRKGEFERVLKLRDYRQFCTELFWPEVDHTYTLELHRRRLIEEIRAWAAAYIHRESIGVDNQRPEHKIGLLHSHRPGLPRINERA